MVDLFGPKNPLVDSGEPLKLPTNKVADFLTYYHKYCDHSNKHLLESVKRAEVALRARTSRSLGRLPSKDFEKLRRLIDLRNEEDLFSEEEDSLECFEEFFEPFAKNYYLFSSQVNVRSTQVLELTPGALLR